MSDDSDQRFWHLDTNEEAVVVKRLMERRFGSLLDDLCSVLDQADPYDLVYPGNPNEYGDVARELLVVLDGRTNVDRAELTKCVELCLVRCFDDDELEVPLELLVGQIANALPPPEMGGGKRQNV